MFFTHICSGYYFIEYLGMGIHGVGICLMLINMLGWMVHIL